MKNPFILCFSIFLVTGTFAQVGIGTVSPNSTLDIRGSFSAAYRSFTASTSATLTDHTLAFTGTVACSVTLPDATLCAGRVYLIKNASTTGPTPVVTIITTSSQTIDGIASWLLDVTYESVILVSNGTNWNVSAQTASANAGTAWTLGGNNVVSMQKFGTMSNFSLPIITNNVERMRVDSMGNVAIGGTTTSGATNAEKLLINAGTTTSPNLISALGSINNYLQLNIQNTSSATLASTDLITTNDASSYVDLGINSSGYNSLAVSPILNGANNAYLYTTGNDFIIGDSTAGKNLIFFTGGAALTNERMRITSAGNIGIGDIVPTTVLDVNGTVKMRSTVQVGAAGTALNAIIRFTNQSITDNVNFDFASPRTETFALAGVSQFASVIVTPRSALPSGFGIAYAYASAANTVKVVITNTSGGSSSLGTIIFDFTVIQ
jgi:hypothetical protein